MDAVKILVAAALAMAMLTAARKPVVPPPTAAAPAPAPTIKTGVEKWRAGDYAAAVAIWQPFAAAGDSDALFNMGQAYKLGRGVAADPATARDYYRKAAVKGHLPAQANLGIALFQAGEKTEAIKWLKTAADRGEARAQYVYGVAAFTGDSLPRSQSTGYGYLLRAKASGLPQAITALASFEPLLSPADRAAGEAVASSLAAGNGTPLLPPSRLIQPLPPVAAAAPAVATVAPTAISPAVAGSRPASVATGNGAAVPPPAASIRAGGAATMADRPVAPRTAPVGDAARAPATPAVPTRLASTRPATIATVDVPASHLDADQAAPPPPVLHSAGDSVAAPAHSAATPLPGPGREVAAATRPAPLRPFEITVEPAHKSDGWRVQLGAFSARKQADAAWAAAKTVAPPGKPIFATDGPVTKLQMGPFPSRDAAKAACAKLTSAGRACFVTQG